MCVCVCVCVCVRARARVFVCMCVFLRLFFSFFEWWTDGWLNTNCNLSCKSRRKSVWIALWSLLTDKGKPYRPGRAFSVLMAIPDMKRSMSNCNKINSTTASGRCRTDQENITREWVWLCLNPHSILSWWVAVCWEYNYCNTWLYVWIFLCFKATCWDLFVLKDSILG